MLITPCNIDHIVLISLSFNCPACVRSSGHAFPNGNWIHTHNALQKTEKQETKKKEGKKSIPDGTDHISIYIDLMTDTLFRRFADGTLEEKHKESLDAIFLAALLD